MQKNKIIIENGIYHVTQRAPGKELLFLEKSDYLYFLGSLKKISKTFNINTFCFALLPNHLHILLKIKNKNLTEAMKFLFQSYATYFNNKYERKGHVFCGRYYASLCEDEKYFLTASLYIHLNPFKARLTNNISSYQWSSLDLYLKPIKNSFIDNSSILSLLSKNTSEAKRIYGNLLCDSDQLEYQNFLKNKKSINMFSIHLNEILEKFNLFNKNSTKKNYLWNQMEKDIDKTRNKKGNFKPAQKRAIAYLIIQLKSCGHSINEISQKLNIHRTTVYRILQHSVRDRMLQK